MLIFSSKLKRVLFISAQSCCLDRDMIQLPNFSTCYEKLKTGYCSTSVYQDIRLKYFDSNFLIQIILVWFRNQSTNKNFKKSVVMTDDQQDKMEIPFDVKIPILINSSFLVLKCNLYACGYHAYMVIWKPLIWDDSLFCKREGHNINHKSAVAVMDSNHIGPRVVVHVPFLYFSMFKNVSFFTKSYNKGVGYWKEN